MIYSVLRRTFPTSAPAPNPRRIVLLRPCCIGDVVLATAALSALRDAFPASQITWAVGPWSARAIAHHPAIDSILDTGADMPLRSPGSMLDFVSRLRAGQFDLAVSLVRSPLMSLAIYLSGIPVRAGLDSEGRGFGYNLRVPIDPDAREHESEIYLKVISAIAGREVQAYANLPVADAARTAILARLAAEKIASPFIVAHPGGGENPGAHLASKRYPPTRFAEILNRVTDASDAAVILLGGPGDGELVSAVASRLTAPNRRWVGVLDFQEIGALAAEALFYIGNDSGLTHLAAASGARAVMLMGPTDPRRYAPFTPDHLALWKPANLPAGGAAKAEREGWDWTRDGFSVDEAAERILDYLDRAPQP